MLLKAHFQNWEPRQYFIQVYSDKSYGISSTTAHGNIEVSLNFNLINHNKSQSIGIVQAEDIILDKDTRIIDSPILRQRADSFCSAYDYLEEQRTSNK